MQLTEITVFFGAQCVMERFSLSLPDRGAVALMGPSGAGKTTLLRVIMGLQKPQSGTVQTQGAKIGCLFQEDRLLPWFTAKENVEAVIPHGSTQKAEEALLAMGLPQEAIHKYPEELSGGMRQRVALARLMCYGGEIWLLDEAFKSLDLESRHAVMEVLKEQAKNRLIVMVTHDRDDAIQMGARIIELEGPPLHIK